MIQNTMIQNAVTFVSAGAQKGAKIAAVKYVAREFFEQRGNMTGSAIALSSGTAAAGVHAGTKIAAGVGCMYRDASASMTAVAAGIAVSRTNWPAPVKLLFIYALTGLTIAAQDTAKRNLNLLFILGGFHAGSKAMGYLIPHIQKAACERFKQISEELKGRMNVAVDQI